MNRLKDWDGFDGLTPAPAIITTTTNEPFTPASDDDEYDYDAYIDAYSY